jgi:RNA polymerase-binding transcription factor DksA
MVSGSGGKAATRKPEGRIAARSTGGARTTAPRQRAAVEAPDDVPGRPEPARAATRTTKAAPVKAAPVKATPAKAAPVKATPVKAAPAKATPAKAAPAKATPATATPVKATAGKDATPERAARPTSRAKAPAEPASARTTATRSTSRSSTQPAAAAAPARQASPAAAPARAATRAAAAGAAGAASKGTASGRATTKRAARPAGGPAAASSARRSPQAAGGRSRAAAELVVRDDEAPWTPAELAEVRSGLEADVARLSSEIDVATTELQQLLRDSGEGTGDDQADAGAKTFEREQEISLANNSRVMLEQSLRALARLDDGTYGVCESCGRPVGKMRLLAFPRATLCVSCKQQQERR